MIPRTKTASVMYANTDVSKLENKYVTAVHDHEEILEAFDSVTELMYAMLAVCLIFSDLMVMVVFYNFGNLSFHERVKEFATLKVLGFSSRQIRKLLSLQNLWLSVLGVLMGLPFGQMLLQYMFDSNGDSFDYPCVVSLRDCLASAAFVLLVSVFVSIFFSKRIKKVDMVEVLKGID